MSRTPTDHKKRSMTPVVRSAEPERATAGVQRAAGVICFTDGTEMQHLKIRNWDRWQSYRSDRGLPPWIKVHRQILRNAEWVSLTDAQRGQLLTMWILAADKDGEVPSDPKVLKILCHMESEPDLDLFIVLGFLDAPPAWRQHDVNVTPTCGIGDASDEGQMKGREGQTLCPAPEAGLRESGIRTKKPSTQDEAITRTLAYLNVRRSTILPAARGYDIQAACHRKFVAARLKAGATEADLKAVIDDRCEAWRDNEAMLPYLRPETLFNATKFAGYLANIGIGGDGEAAEERRFLEGR